MHTSVKAAAAALLVLAGSHAAIADPTPNYQLDPAHSVATFAVQHMGISKVRGQFQKMTGDGYFNGKDYKDAMVEATIDVSSIDTHEPKRDSHLKSADFFDADKFPTITFKSRKIRLRADGHLEILGDLTIHGVTKQVLLVGDKPTPPTNAMGGVHVGASATTTVNRRDFGLLWNKNLDGGGVLIGDDVDITLDVDMVQQQPK